MFKVNRNIRKRNQICSKLTTKTTEQRHLRRSGVFIVNSEHISHLFLVFLLLILNKQMLVGFISTLHLLVLCNSSLLKLHSKFFNVLKILSDFSEHIYLNLTHCPLRCDGWHGQLFNHKSESFSLVAPSVKKNIAAETEP